MIILQEEIWRKAGEVGRNVFVEPYLKFSSQVCSAA